MVRLLLPVPVSDPRCSNKAVPGTRVFSRGRTELSKVSSTGGEVVPSLPKCRVREWRPYRTYQRVGYGYGCCTKLTEGSSTGIYFIPSLPEGRVRVWMFYQAYQRVEYGTAACTHTRTRPQVFQQGRTQYQCIFPRRADFSKVSGTGGEIIPVLPKCRVRVWRPYQTHQRIGYGYICCTKFTEGSGMDIDVVPCLPKGRVRVWMFYQAYQRVEYGTAACTRTRTRPQVFQQGRTRSRVFSRGLYRTYQSVGYGWGSCTKLTKVSGTGMEAVPNLPKGRVRIWMLYQAYWRFEYGYKYHTKLAEGSGTGMMFYQAYQSVEYGTAACTHIRTQPQVFQQGRTRYQCIFPRRADFTKVSGTGGEVVPSLPKCRVRVWMPYRIYQRIGYGYICCTKFTKGSGTDIDVVPCLPKGRVRVWMFY